MTVCDPCEVAKPFYHNRVDTGSYHLSHLDDAGYRDLGKKTTKGKHTLQAGWPRDFTTLPVVRRFTTAPHASHRDGNMPVELIGPVHAPRRDGPTDGMYALQKELRKRIAAGLDWLSIKPLPASDGALPWFWHWDDRRYAVWWDSEGRPFVHGPPTRTRTESRLVNRREPALGQHQTSSHLARTDSSVSPSFLRKPRHEQ